MNKEVGYSCYDDIYLKFEYIGDDEFDELIEYIEDSHLSYEGATDVFMDLQQENKQLKEVNESHRRGLERKTTEIDELRMELDDVQQENEKLKSIWNELKEAIKEINEKNEKWYLNELTSHDKRYYEQEYIAKKAVYNKILDKMQEEWYSMYMPKDACVKEVN